MRFELPGIGVIPMTSVNVSNGRRSLSFGLRAPGKLGACPFDWLQVEACERIAWSGEASLSGRRYVQRGEPDPREYMPQGDWLPLTDKATELLRQHGAPQVAGDRFATGWDEAWRAKVAERTEGCLSLAQQAMRVQLWWEQAAVLSESYAAGALRLVRHRSKPPLRVDVPCERHTERATVEVVAGLELAGGERVGWLGIDGEVIPIGIRLR